MTHAQKYLFYRTAGVQPAVTTDTQKHGERGCALIADLLIKVVKNQIKRKWFFSNITSMIRLHLMTYINLTKFLQHPEKALESYCAPYANTQSSLFPT